MNLSILNPGKRIFHLRFTRHWLTTCSVTFLLSFPIPAQQWQQGGNLNTPRYGAASVSSGEDFIILGGATTGGQILNTVEVYDTATSSWRDDVIPPFSIPRLHAAAVYNWNKIFLTGGLTPQDEVIDGVEVYDFMSGNWSYYPEMDRDRRGHRASTLLGTLCIWGGVRDNGNLVDDIEYWEQDSMVWDRGPDDIFGTRVLPFGATHGGRLYVAGGFTSFPTASTFYGIAGNDWSFQWFSGPNLSIARGHGATAVLGDSLYYMGGETSAFQATDLIEIYNTAADQAEPALFTLPLPLIGLSAATIANQIFICGGYSSNENQPGASTWYLEISPTAIDPSLDPIATDFQLYPAFPNPFNGQTTLRISSASREDLTLRIYNVRGQQVAELLKGSIAPGEHLYRWDGRDQQSRQVSSGVYFAVLQGQRFSNSIKLFYSR